MFDRVLNTPLYLTFTAQKMKFSMRIWSHLLKKSLMENFIFCAVIFQKIRIDTSLKLSNFRLFRFSMSQSNSHSKWSS